MPPRTHADDKASCSGHIHAHTPVHKQGPSNACNQVSKRQKKHQADPDDTVADADMTQEVTRGTKTGKKRRGKGKGKKPRYAHYPHPSPTINKPDCHLITGKPVLIRLQRMPIRCLPPS